MRNITFRGDIEGHFTVAHIVLLNDEERNVEIHLVHWILIANQVFHQNLLEKKRL